MSSSSEPPNRLKASVSPMQHIQEKTTVQNRKGTVLMIHGWAQNAQVMRIKTKTLTKKLNQAGFDCIFLDAPFRLPETSTVMIEGQPVVIENGTRQNARAWFLYSESDPADTTGCQSEQRMVYFGLQEAINEVRRVINGFDGSRHSQNCGEPVALVGFSQGSVFVHILAALANACNPADHPISPFCRIRCAVLASGFQAMHSETIVEDNVEVAGFDGLALPSMHLIGENDTSVEPKLTEKLASCFVDAELLVHEKGHILPQKSAQCSEILSFIEKHI